MKAGTSVSLQNICIISLARFTLEAIVQSSAMNHERKCNRYQPKNPPQKRKRSNSDEIEFFSSNCSYSRFSISKRRKLNESRNYDNSSLFGEYSKKLCSDIHESRLVEINKTKKKDFVDTIKVQSNSVVCDPVINLRLYLKYLPSCLWTDFAAILLAELSKTNPRIHEQICKTIYELLFCSKLTRYSSSSISGHKMEAHLFVERLPFCRNLSALEYTLPYLHEDQSKFHEQLLRALSVLRNLRNLSLTPSLSTIGGSYLTFSVVDNLKFLKDFTFFYDSGLSTKKVNVSCLQHCPHLENIALYCFGKGSEMEHLVDLLRELKNLKFIYHRELPNALIHMYSKNISIEPCKLKLKSFILVAPKREFGSQLVYIPISSLIQVAQMCPLLSNLVLVKPGNLLSVLEVVSGINYLTIHSCNFKESLEESIHTGRLHRLCSLKLINTETAISYNDIIKVSLGCPKLEELEIFNSNLIPSDISNRPETNNSLFPFLKKLILLSLEVHSCKEPFIITVATQWTLGMILAKLMLKGSKYLEILFIEFTPSDSLPLEKISSDLLLSLLIGNTNLKELLLWHSPELAVSFVDTLVQWCPSLNRLRQLNLWNFATPEDKAEIWKRYNYLVS